MGEEENFSIYSAHPDEYTFPVSKLKKIHFCDDICQKKNPGSKCFKHVYRAFSPKKVQHLCPPNCQFTRTYPEIPHLDLELHCEADIEDDQLGDDQVGDDQAGEDQAQNVQADQQLNIGRISRYSVNRCSNPSGYNPSPEALRSLQSRKVTHVQVDRHGKEYTWGAGGDWRNYLSCKEMIKEQGFQRVLELAVEEPYRVLGWFNAATPWGALPSPTNFRFGNPKFYIKLRKKVEQQLGIVIKNRHPYYKVRGGKKNRSY